MARPTFNIDGASYDSKSFLFSSQKTNDGNIYISPDGTKMYLTDSANGIIYQYTLSTAFDISTASYDSKRKTYSSYYPNGIFFKEDGTKVYFTDRSADYVYQCNLSTAWDISTAVATYTYRYDTNNGDYIFGLFIKPDGSKFYTSSYNYIYQYSMSTAWGLNTASYDSKSFNTSAQMAFGGQGIFFNDIGTKMYVISYYTGYIYQYSLSTARDISTASYDNKSFSFSAQDSRGMGMFMRLDNGAKLYINGETNNRIYQYSTYSTGNPGAFFQMF